MNISSLKQQIFNINNEQDFNALSLEIFYYQFRNCEIYRAFVQSINPGLTSINHYTEIPFLPIEFFKSHIVSDNKQKQSVIFQSSGTGGPQTSHHYVNDINIYEKSFFKCFELFYGKPDQYIILALLPSYLERGNSSLIYMTDKLIKETFHKDSGFYNDHSPEMINLIHNSDRRPMIIGVSFALLDLAENYKLNNPELIVIETGGMKGRRKELVREELHAQLTKSFNIPSIQSEYGMTELLSQAYSQGEGLFRTPPWMRVLIRDPNDPLTLIGNNKTGGINIIDLANIHSCSFIATQDLGRLHQDGIFEVLGRFDSSDIRGCNLMVD